MQTKFMQTLYARQKIALLLTLFATSFFASAQSNSSEQIEMKGSKGTTVTGNVLTSFDNPWAMAFLHDGHSLVTEKAGSLWLLDKNQQKRFSVSNVPSVVARGQGGLGDVIIHPDFASNNTIYISYIERDEKDDAFSGAVIERATLTISDSG
ncbi:PQQ-dependent sugar dehydrogenase, partial [Alteromonas sp.]|uniref:PQQ-dependent sugar dehydrogenase n=1 Tax=Alteromonas sp. TaxID=232 RepID=UPI00257F78F1